MANLEAYGEKVVGLTGSVVSWTQTQASGTKIAEIDIDGTTQDVYAPSGGGSSLNYSTTEQVVGTWLGKPLYQITVDTGQLPNNTSKNVAHGVSAIEKVVYFEGYARRTDDAWCEPLPRILVANDAKGLVSIRINATNVTLATGVNLASLYNESYVTFRYTKTTD